VNDAECHAFTAGVVNWRIIRGRSGRLMSHSWPTLRHAAAASSRGFSTVMSWQPVVSSSPSSPSSRRRWSNTGTFTIGSATTSDRHGRFLSTSMTEIFPCICAQFGPIEPVVSANEDT
jgi:hypothetical protein